MDEIIAKVYYNRVKSGQITVEDIPILRIAVIVERMLSDE